MEVVQQESPNSLKKRRALLLASATLVMAVYFLFPLLLIYPVYRIYKGMYPLKIEATINVVFYPVIKLSKAIPAYRRMLIREEQLLGMYAGHARWESSP